jgi:hypothetical protein
MIAEVRECLQNRMHPARIMIGQGVTSLHVAGTIP